MAKPEDIQSDLTLEIAGNPSTDQFLLAIRAFFGCVLAVGRAVAPEIVESPWLVRIRDGSCLIGLDPSPDMPAPVASAVYSAIEEGVRQLSVGQRAGSAFPPTAMKHLIALCKPTNGHENKSVPFSLWVRKRPTILRRGPTRTIMRDWKNDYSDYGTLEGKLEAIQDRDHKSLRIGLRDSALGEKVRCYVPERLLRDAMDSFRKRVEVSGQIHYRRDGRPGSIRAERIEAFPDDSELPTLADVKGILRPPT